MNGPTIRRLADMINFITKTRTPVVEIHDNVESHVLALICIVANPKTYVILRPNMESSREFFESYNANIVTKVTDSYSVYFGDKTKDREPSMAGLAYHPLDSLTCEEVEKIYLDLEHSNLLPY